MKRSLLVALVLTLHLMPSLAFGQAGETPEADAEAIAKLASSIETLKRGAALFEAVRAELAQPGPFDLDRFCSPDLVEPEAIAATVRAKLRFEPYEGKLRGAEGAAAARAANSLDAALLLLALLKRVGIPANLQAVTLTEEEGAARIEAYLATPLISPLLNASPDLEAAPFEALGLNPEQARAHYRQQVRSQGQLESRIAQITEAESEILANYVQAGRGRSFSAWRSHLVAIARSHYFVELEDGRQLDPYFENVDLFQPRARPVGIAAIPEHALHIELRYRRTVNGNLEEVSIVEGRFPSSEALREPIAMTIQPFGIPSGLEMLERSPQEIRATMGAAREFRAALRKGRRVRPGLAFDLTGNTRRIASDAMAGSAGAIAGNIDGKLRDALGASAPKFEFIDLTAILTLERPDGSVVKQERRIVSTLTDDCQCAMPILEWQFLYAPQLIDSEWAMRGGLTAVLDQYEPLVKFALQQTTEPEAVSRALPQRPSVWPSVLIDLALTSESNLVERAKSAGGTLHWQQPRLAISAREWCTKSESCQRVTIDLVELGAIVIPTSPDAAEQTFVANLREGIRETAAESLLLERAFARSPTRSAIGDFQRARLRGLAYVALHPDVDPHNVALADSDLEWIERYERDQLIVALPNQFGSPGAWWSIDPITGTAIGRQDGGRGQATTEEVIAMTVGFALCEADAVYDAVISVDGSQAAGKMIARFLIKQAKCMVFLGLSGHFVGASTVIKGKLFFGGIGVGAAINQTFDGESLIMDAARWVLGQIRGQR